MRVQKIISSIVLLLFAQWALGQIQKDIAVVHFNWLQKSHLNIKKYKREKEQKLPKVLSKSDFSIFSFLEDGGRRVFASEMNFDLPQNLEMTQMSVATLQHTLFFDKEKVQILESQSYNRPEALFFYYKLQLKGDKNPLHLVIYKQGDWQKIATQYAVLFKYLETKKATQYLIFMGANGENVLLKPTMEDTDYCADFKLTNPNTFETLFDDDCRLTGGKEEAILFVSEDIWLPEAEDAAHTMAMRNRLENQLAEFDAQQFSTLIISNTGEKKINQVYEDPQLKIISQNKEYLKYALIWDEDIDVDIEILSIIGNSFFKKNFHYEGIEKEYSVQISDFPTGIYLLKASDTSGRTIIRKFTRY